MAKSQLLTKEQILSVDDSQSEIVDVPEWGGSVKVIGMTGAERDRFENSFQVGKGRKRRTELKDVRAKLVAWTVVDEKGERLFNASDIPALGKKSALALDRVFSVATRS